MAKTNQTDILAKVIELLSPLKSEERQRVVHASMTFLGETQIDPIKPGESARTGSDGGADDDAGAEFPARVRPWFKQSGLSMDQLQEVFHITKDKVDVIASDVPGKSAKEKTVNVYVLTGLSKFLASGESGFDDKLARSVCSSVGCYDNTNHATYLKAKGNYLSGSKEGGWIITGPGLKHAAELVKQLTRVDG
jgi:hypothetical protein